MEVVFLYFSEEFVNFISSFSITTIIDTFLPDFRGLISGVMVFEVSIFIP